MSSMMLDTAVPSNLQAHRPTNRCNPTPTLGVDQIGVDTIRVRLPHRGHGLTNRHHRERLDYLSGEVLSLPGSAHELLASGVCLVADERHGQYVTFEMSVPRLLLGTNVRAARLQDAVTVVRGIQSESQHIVDWQDDAPQAQVCRIDLVRDVQGVDNPQAVLDALAQVPTKAKTRRRYTDAEKGGAESLAVGTKGRWIVTIYDKAAERASALRRNSPLSDRAALATAADLARSVLRIEVGVRAAPLRERLGTNTLADLREDLLMDTAHHFFKRAGLATPVGGRARVTAALTAMAEHPQQPADKRVCAGVIGLLTQIANGYPVTVSHNTADAYLAVARRYGLTPADFSGTTADAGVRIDWRTATVQDVA